MARAWQPAAFALLGWIALTGPARAQEPVPGGPSGLVPPPTTPPPATSAGSGGPSDIESNSGYVDSALPTTQFRLRYDSAYDGTRLNRAEFFYPKNEFDPKVDYQELTSYIEVAYQGMLSVFLEVPVRWVNPSLDVSASGLSDITAGFKWAFLTAPCLTTSFQMRTTFPTRVGPELGNFHYSLEPGLLTNWRPLDGVTVEGELRYWIPLDGTDFAGDIVRYGVAVSFGSREPDALWVTPVVELVGWTVLGGKETAFLSPTVTEVQNAAGDTIVNVKAGLRFGLSDLVDMYLGYGRALTGDVWYRDVVRAEVRVRF